MVDFFPDFLKYLIKVIPQINEAVDNGVRSHIILSHNVLEKGEEVLNFLDYSLFFFRLERCGHLLGDDLPRNVGLVGVIF